MAQGATMIRVLSLAALIAVLVGCTPMLKPRGEAFLTAGMTEDAFVMTDGAVLPFRAWGLSETDAAPEAVILALHGFNDYSNAFDRAAQAWAELGIVTYAYDQRGFGRAPFPGRWAGVETMVDDAVTVAQLVQRRHPKTPLILLGESMGGSVLMTAAATRGAALAGDRIVLSAPAVWGRAVMPWGQRTGLETVAFAAPWLPLSGRGLGKIPSDNIEMLRELGRDPLVIKVTRADAIWGLVNLMDAARDAAGGIDRPVLALYGAREDLIPAEAWRSVVETLSARPDTYVKIYETGFHMLLRDLNGEIVIGDIATYAATGAPPDPAGPLDPPGMAATTRQK